MNALSLCCAFLLMFQLSACWDTGDREDSTAHLMDLDDIMDSTALLSMGEKAHATLQWTDTQPAPNVPLANFTEGSIKIVTGSWLNLTSTGSINTTEPTANNTALTTAFFYPAPGCLGAAVWTLESKEDCRSEPLTAGGELRLQLCSSGSAAIIGHDEAVIRPLRKGCHSTAINKAVEQWNDRCRRILHCSNCSTIPGRLCNARPQCKVDGAFDPVFYAEKYSNRTAISAIARDTDKLVQHWITSGINEKLLGCNGCCPGKALVPNCAYTAVGCSLLFDAL